MITVKRKPNGIEIDGHALYDEPGKDIVCAAVSALIQTLIASIEELTQDNLQYDLMPGLANLRYKNLSTGAQTLVDSFFVGVRMIADEYPAYVRLIV